LKFRANALRSQLNPDKPNAKTLHEAERLLAEASAVRDRIIRANMRLVISIVKKFVGPQHSFDDMLSEGAMSLMHAVDKFDYDRGFRFSTYAYRAIARNAYRTIMDRHKENSRFAPGSDVVLFDVVDERDDGWISEQAWSRLRNRMAGILDKLDRREQFIIRSRFALGAHRRVRTFQSLADRLGISKERVRQLEQRAVEKLRKMASDCTPE
jgi:RNA polymerase primary sigma factor